MRRRPRLTKTKRTRFGRCPKCGKQTRVHQIRCKSCSRALKTG